MAKDVGPAIERALRGNLADRVVEYFAPVRAIERKRARAASALLGGYVGGDRSRRATKTWIPAQADADAALYDRIELVDRSQDLERNNSLARGALNTVTTSVVGPGLKLNATIDRDVLGLDEEEADAWEETVQREFGLWAETPDCDLERRVDFYGLQELAFRSTLTAGDVLALLPFVERERSGGSPYGLKVQLVEAARVSNKDRAPDSPSLIDGVEKDANGAAIAYHVSKYHPGARVGQGQQEWRAVPAYTPSGRRNAIHLARYIRPGQTRGEPYLAPVIESLKQLGRYSEAELMAAVTAGMFTVALKTASGQGINPFNLAAGSPQPTTDPTKDEYQLGYGAFLELGRDDEIETINPGRPNAIYEPFVLAISREIGVAIELPFEVLVKHFTTSYSASMASLLEAWRFFLSRRSWLARVFCQVIYELWLFEAVARGRVTAPGYFDDPIIRRAYAGSIWTGPSKGQIREDVETKAAVERIDNGLSSLTREVPAITGQDWETIHRQRVKEHKSRRRDGLAEAAPPTPDSGGANDRDLDV